MGLFVFYLEDFARTDFSLQALRAGGVNRHGALERMSSRARGAVAWLS